MHMDMVESRPMDGINHTTTAQDNDIMYMERVGAEGVGDNMII